MVSVFTLAAGFLVAFPTWASSPPMLFRNASVVKLDDEGDRQLTLMRWGLIPFFSKDDKAAFKSTSARAETIATLPTFREAFKRRHCIVPADWFYEWQALDPQAQENSVVGDCAERSQAVRHGRSMGELD